MFWIFMFGKNRVNHMQKREMNKLKINGLALYVNTAGEKTANRRMLLLTSCQGDISPLFTC